MAQMNVTWSKVIDKICTGDHVDVSMIETCCFETKAVRK